MNLTEQYKSHTDITELSELIQDTSPVDGIDIVVNVSLSLILNTLLFLIFAYLHNLTMAKQCILLALYKEFIIVLVLTLSLDHGQLYLDWDVHTRLPHELDSCHNHNHLHENRIHSTPVASKHNPAPKIPHEQRKNA